MKLFKQVQLHKIVTDSECHHRIWWDIVTPSILQPHPVYPDFNRFGSLKNAVCGTRCDDVVCTVKTWLCEQNKAWNWQVIHTLIPHLRKAVKVDRGFA
jgi:hypothetical protein